MRILGIETSFDETAAAVAEDGEMLLSNVVSSSVDLHKAYGGVVPEIAARSHLEVIMPVIDEALLVAGCGWDDIDAIAVTYGPGLSGSLLIGVLTARTLAICYNKPLLAINHVEAHIYANFLTRTSLTDYKLPLKIPSLPLLSLIVSGGHTQLVLVHSHNEYRVLGRTRDDAVGEAYDKVAKMLGLPYPGGPSVSRAATAGNPDRYPFPKSKLADRYDFSFSGLKTAVLRAAQAAVGKDFTLPSSRLPELLSNEQKADLAASFQKTAIATLVDSLELAYRDTSPASVIIGGGVAADRELRKQIKNRLSSSLEYTDIRLCTDNAAMVAAAAFYKKNSSPASPYSLDISPSLAM